MRPSRNMFLFIVVVGTMVAQLNDMGEPTIENVVILKILCNLPLDYRHVIFASDSIPKAPSRLYKTWLHAIIEGENIDKTFCRTRQQWCSFLFFNSRGGTFEKSNMEVKKKKSAKHITELKKKMHYNYCYEKGQWVKIL